MNNVWICSEKTLSQIHQEVKESCTFQEFQESQLKKNQKQLLEKIQFLQENLCINFIQQSLYGADVKISKPFYETEFNFEIQKTLDQFGLNKQSINQFIYLLTKNIQKFAETIDFNKMPSINSQAPFIPYDLTPFQFILYSTLPSIFGYCWCSELAESYINFIFHALAYNPTFLDTYMTYSFSNFIRVSNGSIFFKSTMTDVLLDIIKNSYTKIKEQELYEKASTILINMKKNISLLPRHVRRIIRRFFGEKESTIMSPESFVVYCLIIPALKQPKEWGIVDPTVMITSATLTNLNSLSYLFQEALIKVSLKDLKQHLLDFVSECDNVDESSDLVQVSQIMPLMGSDTLHLVFSLPDLIALVYLVKNSGISDILKQINENIPTDKPVPLIFTQIDLKEYSQYQITATGEQITDSSDNNILISTFFKFFEETSVCNTAPHNLKDFISFHKRKAELENKVTVQLILQKLIKICPPEGSVEWNDITPSLEDELQRQKVILSLGEEKISKLAAITEILDQTINDLQILFESPKSIYPSLLFETFIDMNIDIKTSFEKRSVGYAFNLDSFYSLFDSITKKINDQFSDVSVVQKVIFNLHSWLMLQIPFDSYQSSHREFAELDEILFHPPEESISYYCIDPAPKKDKILFEYTNIFEEAIDQLKQARNITIPLVALKNFKNCVNMLNRLFMIEYGSSAQADELTPLIHYLLLSAHIPDLYSFVMYMNDFLSVLSLKGLMIMEESDLVGLTHIVNHVKSITGYLKTGLKNELQD